MERSLLLLTLCLSVIHLEAQEYTDYFDIQPAKFKVGNSLYRSITFVDARQDTSPIGIVQVGPLKNKDAFYYLRTPVQPQLAALLSSLTDSTAKDGELLFRLKRFGFAEASAARYCFLAADLYAKKDGRYIRLSALDTLIIMTSANIEKILMREGNKIIAHFIADALTQEPGVGDSPAYGLNDLADIDSIERSRIPAYSTTNYVDGIYRTWSSFMMQSPDMQGYVSARSNGMISSVSILGPDGKKTRLGFRDFYAVIYNRQPFIVTEYGYYPLIRSGNDFYFTGDVRVIPGNAEIITGFLIMGGVWVYPIEGKGYRSTYRFVIDPRNGGFIHLKAYKTDYGLN